MQTEHHEKERLQNNSIYEKLKNNEKAAQDKVASLMVKLSDATNQLKHFEEINNELRSRVSSLQTELDNSEAVQKDFVRLSQSLQVSPNFLNNFPLCVYVLHIVHSSAILCTCLPTCAFISHFVHSSAILCTR